MSGFCEAELCRMMGPNVIDGNRVRVHLWVSCGQAAVIWFLPQQGKKRRNVHSVTSLPLVLFTSSFL